MQDSEGTEGGGGALRALQAILSEAPDASDAFHWLTTDGADTLRVHAMRRQGMIDRVRDDLRAPGNGAAFNELALVARLEVAAEKKVAAWLRSQRRLR